jgi:excisionase family DNA binding protein
MAHRRFNPRIAKSHRTYTVEEVAGTFGVHKNTVRRWVAEGLPVIDARRPMLIHGHDLAAFIAERQQKLKSCCGLGQIYCLACRAPKQPAGRAAECILDDSPTGNLRGTCPDCNHLMHRRVSLARLAEVRGPLDITFTRRDARIEGVATPCDSSDLERQGAS